MTGEPIYGQTLKQSLETERLCRAARISEGSLGTIPDGKPSPEFARLMTVGSQFPKYRSTQQRNAALFEYRPELATSIVTFHGENLWGNVSLTVGSISIEIDCRADQETLRSRLNLNTEDVRVTVFPGLWEFAFSNNIAEIPTITCEPVVTSSSQRFLGGCVIYQGADREGWRSVSSNRSNYDTVKVLDSIPFIEGEVKLGSMALCQKLTDGVYVAGQWSCPPFTFRSL